MIVELLFVAIAPANNLGTLFERGTALADEVALRHPDLSQGVAHRWPGAFTHADRIHIGGFYECDLDPGFQPGVVPGRQYRGCQPTCGTTTNDQNVF
mgnify:FL=1